MANSLRISHVGLRGVVGRGLTASHVLQFASAFGSFLSTDGPVVVGRDPRSSGRTAYRSAEVVLAVLASAHERRPVSLPLRPDGTDPLRQFFAWDGVPRGGRGTVYATDGTVSARGGAGSAGCR